MSADSPHPSGGDDAVWGSDVIADTLRQLELPYLAFNPGASFRGLHDSVVNALGNVHPKLLLFLHEEHAVACAHGYAKVTGRPLAVALHSNVGVMHAAMAVFNAYCDRVPMLLVGATGPLDAARRRPWIEWVHTAADQAAVIRPYIKWDDQPTSLDATVEALLRGAMLTQVQPCAPVYVSVDVTVQETPVAAVPPRPDVSRFAPPGPARPSDAALDAAEAALRNATRPLVMCGRVSRDPVAWDERIELVELLGAAAVTDLKVGAAFPNSHPQHVGSPGYFLEPAGCEALRAADVILSLDWVDLGGTLRQVWTDEAVSARVISVSSDLHLHAGWSRDHGSLPPVDVGLLAAPDSVVPLLLERLTGTPPRQCWLPSPSRRGREPARSPVMVGDASDGLSLGSLAGALQAAVSGTDTTLVRLPLSWGGDLWSFTGPLDYLGGDGGAGIGSGPGMAVGVALALRDDERFAVAVLGDGDFLMGVTALWTAVSEGVPLLVVVANNRSYFNDELHQDRVAVVRGRPRENRVVGQRLEGPTIDLAALARAQGAQAWGPVTSSVTLDRVLQEAVEAVRAGGVAVVDVWVERRYHQAMADSLIADATAGSTGDPC